MERSISRSSNYDFEPSFVGLNAQRSAWSLLRAQDSLSSYPRFSVCRCCGSCPQTPLWCGGRDHPLCRRKQPFRLWRLIWLPFLLRCPPWRLDRFGDWVSSPRPGGLCRIVLAVVCLPNAWARLAWSLVTMGTNPPTSSCARAMLLVTCCCVCEVKIVPHSYWGPSTEAPPNGRSMASIYSMFMRISTSLDLIRITPVIPGRFDAAVTVSFLIRRNYTKNHQSITTWNTGKYSLTIKLVKKKETSGIAAPDE